MSTAMFGSNNMITGGIFQQINTNSNGSFDPLTKAASPAAFHNSNDRRDPPKCHPNTRVAVLQKIMNWIHGLDPEMRDALILWLYGPAGSGKSAIAQSIAEMCYEEGTLLASYFFSRFDSRRNHPLSLIPTIAYQVTLSFPSMREHIITTIDHDPLIFTRSLYAQILALVIEPLQQHIDAGYFDTPSATRVVIIDGLDECEDRNGQLDILSAISRALQTHHLPLIFLMASRPEHDIKHVFSLGHLKDVSMRIPLDDEYLPSDDIHLFLQEKFTEMKESHPFRAQIPATWPEDDVLKVLVEKSSGQFIYASTVIKFVQSSRHRPPQRLEIILGIRPVQREIPFAELDALYMHIFSTLLDPEAVLQVLASHFLSLWSSWRLSYTEELLSLAPGDISVLFCDLSSIISIQKKHLAFGGEQELKIFHASLEDFLRDQSRSRQFWINVPLRHAEFAHLLIQLKARSEMDAMAAIDLVHHITKAAPTLELRDDLTNFSLGSFLVDCQNPADIPAVFAFIKQWFDEGIDLHGHQMHLFDQFAQGVMEEMYSLPSLTALVAVTSLKICYFDQDGNHLFRLDDVSRALDQLSLAYEVQKSSDYREFLLDFLGDPTRSGMHGLTGERYAIAAVYFLKYICSHSAQIIRSSSGLRPKYRRRRNIPWLWHMNLESTRPSEGPRLIQRRAKWYIMDSHQRIYLNKDREAKSTPLSTFLLALRCFSHVLPLADRSEELITTARRRSFGPFSQLYPQKTQIAKQKIARYLERVDPGKPSSI